jgi:hypothetical protein
MEIGERFPERVTRASGPPPFDPNSIAGLKGWWSADAITVGAILKGLKNVDLVNPFPVGSSKQSLDPKSAPPNGSGITIWEDASENGNHAIPTGINSPPTYTSNAINGKPAVHFTGAVGSCLQLTTPFVVASGWTIFTVCKLEPAAVPDICSIASFSADACAGPLNNGISYYLGHNGWYQSTTAVGDYVWHVITGSTTPALYLDGVSIVASQVTTQPPSNFDRMGARATNNYSTGYIAEILAYQGVLSAADITKVNNYLTGKYAITPPAPPLIEPPPEGVTGLKAWYRADAEPGFTDGVKVGSVHDVTGNGWNATNPVAAAQPVFKANIFNGKPALRFDGVDDVLISTCPLNPNPSTLFVVCKSNVAAASQPTMGIIVGSGNAQAAQGNNIRAHLNATTNWGSWARFNGDLTSGEDLVAGEANILAAYTGVYQSGIGAIYRNGVRRNSVAGGDNLAGATTYSDKLTLGGNADPGGWSNVDITEVLAYDRVLSDADRVKIEDYLSAKYAIPLPRNFDPKTIAGLKGWWKADALAVADGTAIAAWPDSSIVGNNATQTTPALQPTYFSNVLRAARDRLRKLPLFLMVFPLEVREQVAREVEKEAEEPAQLLVSKPILRFTNNYLSLATAIPGTAGATFTVIGVMKADNTGAADFVGLAGNTGVDSSAAPRFWGGGGALFVQFGGNMYGGSPSGAGAFHVYTCTSAPGIFKDGVALSSAYFSLATTGDFVAIGKNSAGAVASIADLAELLIYDSVLSDTDRKKVEEYLAGKYGL